MKALPRHIAMPEHVNILKMLLDTGVYGAGVNEQLVFAVQDQNEAALRLLRASDASLDRNDSDALIEASRMNKSKHYEYC